MKKISSSKYITEKEVRKGKFWATPKVYYMITISSPFSLHISKKNVSLSIEHRKNRPNLSAFWIQGYIYIRINIYNPKFTHYIYRHIYNLYLYSYINFSLETFLVACFIMPCWITHKFQLASKSHCASPKSNQIYLLIFKRFPSIV